jgi:hypothetical protein
VLLPLKIMSILSWPFRNANLDGCKDALPSLCSSEDDEDDKGHEKQSDVCLPSHLNITGVISG